MAKDNSTQRKLPQHHIGWSVRLEYQYSNSDATYADGSLAHGSSQGFVVDASTGAQTAQALNWTVQASDDPSGANSINCDGDLSMSIMPQPSQINISNAGVT